MEKPVFDCERTRRTPLLPFTVVSSGNVTSFSTSSGAIPGASVITTTVGAFRSGKMSTSVRKSTMVPKTSRIAAKRQIARRLFSEKRIILFSMAPGV